MGGLLEGSYSDTQFCFLCVSYFEIMWAFELPLRHFRAMLVLKNVNGCQHTLSFSFPSPLRQKQEICMGQGAQKQQKPKEEGVDVPQHSVQGLWGNPLLSAYAGLCHKIWNCSPREVLYSVLVRSHKYSSRSSWKSCIRHWYPICDTVNYQMWGSLSTIHFPANVTNVNVETRMPILIFGAYTVCKRGYRMLAVRSDGSWFH